MTRDFLKSNLSRKFKGKKLETRVEDKPKTTDTEVFTTTSKHKTGTETFSCRAIEDLGTKKASPRPAKKREEEDVKRLYEVK